MPIDWDAVGLAPPPARAAKPQTFTQDQIDAAVQAAQALPGRKGDPTKVDTLWDVAKDPGLKKLDFRDVKVTDCTVADLLASNKSLDRARLIWHCQNPGQAKNPSVFTTNPMVLNDPDGQVIIDGQHRLAALKLLGAVTWPCWLIPTK